MGEGGGYSIKKMLGTVSPDNWSSITEISKSGLDPNPTSKREQPIATGIPADLSTRSTFPVSPCHLRFLPSHFHFPLSRPGCACHRNRTYYRRVRAAIDQSLCRPPGVSNPARRSFHSLVSFSSPVFLGQRARQSRADHHAVAPTRHEVIPSRPTLAMVLW